MSHRKEHVSVDLKVPISRTARIELSRELDESTLSTRPESPPSDRGRALDHRGIRQAPLVVDDRHFLVEEAVDLEDSVVV